jgi:hypothetical protein
VRAAAGLLLALAALPAGAQVPAMDSATTCAHVAQVIGDPAIVERCLADEAAAQGRLAPVWEQLPLDIAGGCVAHQLDGNPGSYQILALCIEDGLAAAGLPSPLPPQDD